MFSSGLVVEKMSSVVTLYVMELTIIFSLHGLNRKGRKAADSCIEIF